MHHLFFKRSFWSLFLCGFLFLVPTSFAQTSAACTSGKAGAYPCKGVDLKGFIASGILGMSAVGENAVDVSLSGSWGWTDPQTGKDYALVGHSRGTSFVDVSDPSKPIFLGMLPVPTTGRESAWRELKTYKNHVFIVGDAAGQHGMQVFDLTQLRNVPNPPLTFKESARYTGVASTHEIAINEETGTAYLVGVNGSSPSCGGGLHMVDIREPLNPKFLGCYTEPRSGLRGTGYTHDVQCVLYRGPDTRFTNREMCFNFNETALVISDVTNKTVPETISITSYPKVSYSHQGWITPDGRYLYMDDELDEMNNLTGGLTRTLIWNISNLARPELVKEYFGTTGAIDHNQYVKGRYLYQSNYTAGVRILDIIDPANPVEVGYFDCVPAHDNPEFTGVWNAHPYFKNGAIVMNCIDQGLFIVKPQITLLATETEALPQEANLLENYPNPFSRQTTIRYELAQETPVSLRIYDLMGRIVATPVHALQTRGLHEYTVSLQGLPSGTYFYELQTPKQTLYRKMVYTN